MYFFFYLSVLVHLQHQLCGDRIKYKHDMLAFERYDRYLVRH